MVKKKKKIKIGDYIWPLEFKWILIISWKNLSMETKKKEERKKEKKRKLSVVKLLYDIFDKLNQQKIKDKCMYFWWWFKNIKFVGEKNKCVN